MSKRFPDAADQPESKYLPRNWRLSTSDRSVCKSESARSAEVCLFALQSDFDFTHVTMTIIPRFFTLDPRDNWMLNLKKERKHYPAGEDVAILRRHLLDKIPFLLEGVFHSTQEFRRKEGLF